MYVVTRVCVFLFILSGLCAMVNPPTMEDSFKQCLVSKPSGTLAQCIGIGAISKLQSWDNDPEFDLIDGVTLTKDGNQEFRDSYNFADRDPADFRTLVDSLSHVFSHRNLRWDLNFLYPGLAMHVAPSGTPGGILEFILDPHRENINANSLKEASTGKILARQFLLPFLLGFKFNIATILPILFGLLALIAKKAVIISKIALIASSAFGLGSLLLGNGNVNNANKYPQTYQTGGAATFNPGFGSNYNRYPEEEYPEVYYRGMTNGNKGASDQLNLYSNLQNAYDRTDKAKGRNFAWSESEKGTKSSSSRK